MVEVDHLRDTVAITLQAICILQRVDWEDNLGLSSAPM